MTIKEIANQLIMLSESKMFGIETENNADWIEWRKFSESSLYTHLRNNAPKLNVDYVLHIDLPDGKWLLFIHRFSGKIDGFDYFIPENREEEARLLSMAFAY